MDENIYTLFWGGIFFLTIGLWMWKKDRNQIQLMDKRMTEKENSLYELYQDLEEIMNQMFYLYRDKVEQDILKTNTKEGQIISVLQNKQEQKKEDQYKKDQYKKEENRLHGDNKQYEELPVNKYYRIVELKHQGYTEDEIAKELEIGKGEVRLILEFNRYQE